MHKKLYFNDEVLEKVLAASQTFAKHVGSTMGPNGKNVIIKNISYPTLVTQDGVTVARSLEFKDEAENSVADIIKQAAMQLEELVGDGTTTVTVLIDAILQEANKLMTIGVTPKEIVIGLNSYAKKIFDFIELRKEEVDLDKLIQVATISAKNEIIGKLVAETIHDLGENATVTTQESATGEDEVETVKGFELPFGWVSHYMAPNREIEMESPYIVVCDMPLRDKQDVMPIFKEIVKQENKSVLIFARQIGGDALSLMVINKLKKVIDVVAVEITDGDIAASDIFQDLAVATGAKIISRSNGRPVDGFVIEDAGSATKALIEKDKTSLIGYQGAEEDIAMYVQGLQNAHTKTKFEREQIAKRISQIESRVATIYVGGKTPSEIQERMFRVDDAIGAAKTALKSGIVVGGGYVFHEAAGKFEANTIAERALKIACDAPRSRIIENGAEELQFTELKEKGVYDPVGTLMECLRTAVSTASILLLSGSMIMEAQNEDKATS